MVIFHSYVKLPEGRCVSLENGEVASNCYEFAGGKNNSLSIDL